MVEEEEEEALPQHGPFSQHVLLLVFSMLLCLQEDDESSSIISFSFVTTFGCNATKTGISLLFG